MNSQSYVLIVWGGVIYSRLDEPFLSPTINLWIGNKDFVRFCARLEKYLNQDLSFEKAGLNYPVGIVDDIRIHFNHAKTESEAKMLWDKRKERVRFDNLYLLMVGIEGLSENDIRIFGDIPCRNRAILTHEPMKNCDFYYPMKKSKFRKNANRFMDKGADLKWSFEKQFDFVKWLNDGIR